MKIKVKRHQSGEQRTVLRKTLRKKFGQYIKSTPGFNKKSYGEILFKNFGTKTTFSAYATCTPSTAPEDVWRLLLEFWNMNVPNVIFSVAGDFDRYDAEWKGIMDNTWLVTGGTAPSQATSYACTIAIMSIGSVADNGALFSLTNDGVFPVIYQVPKNPEAGKKLDFAHTHFIFVQGDDWEALEFRENLLQYIATIPIEMDASFTEFITTPVVVAMVSDDPLAVMHVSGKNAKTHPVVVSKSAPKFYMMLSDLAVANQMHQNEGQAIFSSDAENKLRAICNELPEDVDRQSIEIALKENIFYRKDVRHYPSPGDLSLDIAVLHAAIENKKTSFRSRIQLALAWNRMDVIKYLVPTKKVFQKEEEAYPVYLVMALMLDRSEFLEYLEELGIHLCEYLTVKILWSIYFKPLFKEGFGTRFSHLLHNMLYSDGECQKTHLLRDVGKAIGSLTHHVITSLYSDPIYHYFDPTEVMDLKTRRTSILTQYDDTSKVPYAARDLFLWSVLMGKDELTDLFWKDGHSLMATSIMVSAMAKSQSVLLDNTLEGSDLAEERSSTAKEWEETAIDFLTNSFKTNRSTTLCQLTQKIDTLGGCSVIDLAYNCKHREFIAHPAVQTALDYIWYGMTKQEQPLWKVIVTLVCPIAVPCLNLIERKDIFSTTMARNYRSLFTDVETELELKEEQGQSGFRGVLNIMERWGGETVRGGSGVTRHSKAQSRLVSAMRDTYDYFNSPRVKFLVHAMFMTIVISLMSYYLLTDNTKFNLPDTPCFAISIVLFSYFFGLTVDELRQLGTSESRTAWGKLKAWIASPWNKMDLVLVSCYFTGQTIMWTGAYDNQLWYVGKTLLCIALFAMYIRCFQVYLVFKYFGPKVYMMRKMLKDLVVFLSIMGLIFLCYGVILTALDDKPNARGNKEKKLRINSTSLDTFVLSWYNHILRRPYWQLYGNGLNNASKAVHDFYELLRVLATCFYVLFSNILMLNLLIAMFSYTFQNIQDRSGIFWSFHRFDVVAEFCDRPWLPSPFVIFEDIIRFINSFRDVPETFSPFKKPVQKEQKSELFSFERDVLEIMLKDEQEKKKQKNLLNTVVQIQKGIEAKLEHLQNIEISRLAIGRLHSTQSTTPSAADKWASTALIKSTSKP